MKILTGALKGRTIAYKPNPHLRPTADKTRKAIFDMLQGQFEGKTVLDLFSGTGALGFEALSQGADRVTFVESEKSQALSIKRNLTDLGLSGKSKVIAADAIRSIEKLSRDGDPFDFILMDPPYDTGLGERTLSALLKSDILKKDTLIILECRDSKKLPDAGAQLTALRDKSYGDARIVIYRHV
ncbi:MAG: 16S rRNA (guanine(966)-N(2))-methyltransferase RsmD [Candidatus Omnitrophica bacterium CG1_02_49_16]|nr:MAG: 16S rRNA (guanine(966)-N(2))-methyltransferase RsmD [Candidatus Omnitrophica bacterium CG1_02_49_16]